MLYDHTITPVLRSHISEYSASAALFQCQHSAHQDGQVFTPNIPDYYFNHTNADTFFEMGTNSLLTQSSDGFTYFFTIPPESAGRNCSGTVVAIQYCYQVHKDHINSTQDAFSFHSVTRDGFDFTVTSSFTVRTTPHQEDECTMRGQGAGGMHYFCCDTTTLSDDDQLSISPESYTFGVTIIVNNDVTQYAFRDNTEFVVDQFQGSLGTILSAGTNYSFTESTKVNAGLLLMRLIGNNIH